eukprot:Gb_29165 [translate_table: standard]
MSSLSAHGRGERKHFFGCIEGLPPPFPAFERGYGERGSGTGRGAGGTTRRRRGLRNKNRRWRAERGVSGWHDVGRKVFRSPAGADYSQNFWYESGSGRGHLKKITVVEKSKINRCLSRRSRECGVAMARNPRWPGRGTWKRPGALKLNPQHNKLPSSMRGFSWSDGEDPQPPTVHNHGWLCLEPSTALDLLSWKCVKNISVFKYPIRGEDSAQLEGFLM